MNSLSSLTPVEVAELLKITKNTVYELIKRGELPGYKVGKQIRVDIKDVEEYINKQKTTKLPSLTNSTSSDSSEDIIISGQDILLDILGGYIEKKLDNIKVFRSSVGSYNGLYNLYNDKVSISSCHLWDGDTDTYNTPYVKALLPGVPCVLINLAYRNQGFYVQKGNPKNINSWNDLTNSNVTLVNREKGSGTRVLLDEKLRLFNISPNEIKGYKNEESSHLSVASAVGRGMADVGLGNEKCALQIDSIDFIQLQKERYDLVIKEEDFSKPAYQAIIEILSSDEFKKQLEAIGGYDLKDTGKVLSKI